jgi:hypothetical protein
VTDWKFRNFITLLFFRNSTSSTLTFSPLLVKLLLVDPPSAFGFAAARVVVAVGLFLAAAASVAVSAAIGRATAASANGTAWVSGVDLAQDRHGEDRVVNTGLAGDGRPEKRIVFFIEGRISDVRFNALSFYMSRIKMRKDVDVFVPEPIQTIASCLPPKSDHFLRHVRGRRAARLDRHVSQDDQEERPLKEKDCINCRPCAVCCSIT